MTDRLSPEREAEIAERMDAPHDPIACGKDCLILAHQDAPALLAELAAVRAERDRYRERALDAENRSIVDGREVCADCGRPVPDGPCGVHSPDAVFQRACREAAWLRADRDRARERALREAADHFDRLADFEPDQGYRARVMRGAANDIRRLIATPTETAEEAS